MSRIARRIRHSTDVITTTEALAEAVEYFLRHDAFAFDVETMGDNRGVPTQNNVTWIALATYGRTIVIPMGHPNGSRLLQRATRRKSKVTGKFDQIAAVYDAPPRQLNPSEVFEALRPLFFSNRTKIAHNATFDLISVAKYFGGVVPPGPHEDTIVIQHLINENLLSKGLKDLIIKYFGVKYDHENVGKFIEGHPFDIVAHYAYMDAKFTWFLWRFLRPFIKEPDDTGRTLEQITDDVEMPLIAVLCEMGLEGAPVDMEALRELEVDLSARIIECEADVYRAAGKKFNINSSPQKAHVLFGPKTEGGQGLKPKVPTDGGKKKADKGMRLELTDYSTGAEILEDRYSGNGVVDALLKFQEVNKLLGTYVQGYLGVEGNPKKPCRIFNGRVHTDLVQYGTVTGRFSSREPNLQNIPRPDTELGNKIRGLFRAPEGQRMVVADYGQIEMIILAHLIGYGALFDGIKNGMDPHSATAAGLAGIDPVKFMELVAASDPDAKKARQIAKGVNFAVVYGAGPEKVASMAGIKVAEAKRFLEIHQKMFPEIYAFKDYVLNTARSRNPPSIRTLLGRVRRLPGLRSNDYGSRGYAERQAVNSLIQGSAADIIKLAMLRLHETLEPGMRLILSVHDELVVLCDEDVAERCAEIVHEAMLGDEICGLLKVPLTTDVKIVQRWSEAK